MEKQIWRRSGSMSCMAWAVTPWGSWVQITAPIARAKGNIVDLRQDVLHGLFTIYMVVDLSGSQLTAKKLQTLIDQIGEQTGLELTASPYRPVARRPDKKNLLMICIGRDKPGIIASSAEMLGKYNANIELAQTIGREGIFVMELITDVSHCTLPLANLQQTIRKKMAAMSIRTIFQERACLRQAGAGPAVPNDGQFH